LRINWQKIITVPLAMAADSVRIAQQQVLLPILQPLFRQGWAHKYWEVCLPKVVRALTESEGWYCLLSLIDKKWQQDCRWIMCCLDQMILISCRNRWRCYQITGKQLESSRRGVSHQKWYEWLSLEN
jgi:hypothetical protein